ncbi:MAG: glycosyl hydrolase 115 family protein [Lachnospiraceae bacterium]|nr:glycosyl hydrolase 115 family protein [Lachnospiraceae bacterium]
MEYKISTENIRSGKNAFVYGEGEWSGVLKIADRVADDMKAVFGRKPELTAAAEAAEKTAITMPVLFGTVGKSALIASLGAAGIIDLSEVEGKREVYSFTLVKNCPKNLVTAGAEGNFPKALVIAGSEKRGTVYGLFHLSEMLGVSPFIDWLDMKPARLAEFALEDGFHFVSKEPSVRFRGFFINDEWPAFGNFCNRNYGGFNAKVYTHVFELLLRLKGNYLWPAMWSAVFPEDGPGLENARLADELGVVMGASHHEPCCRQGEEYSHVRGKDSVYGDAWNFLSNEKGITRFWEDGLKRSGGFENVITVGMRGEADTAILGREATLADNIDLLRSVLKTQNRLIRKYVNQDLDSVPRMLALYKEVEPYFYGDETTPGLMDDPELEGVTLMLCDDNYGNLRTLPTAHMRSHKGGYGMYYHFDYHGYPISYEWFNTSYLPKVWEQMTAAYDNGIRELWIVNVGDIFSNEFPLAYFLDLAYDYERYGSSDTQSAVKYTKEFAARHFAGILERRECAKIAELLRGYTKITGARRTEAMNDDVYAPFAYGECENLLAECDRLMKAAEKLRGELPEEAAFGYYELVYLPLMANLNVQRMWLLTTLNHAYATMGSTYAMALAKEIRACMDRDCELTEELHTIHHGKWYGMGMSEHIGFHNWCEEECLNPIIHTFEPADKERLIVSVPDTDQHTEGTPWTARVLTLPAFLDPAMTKASIRLSTASVKPVRFRIETTSDAVAVSRTEGIVRAEQLVEIAVTVDRSKLGKDIPEIIVYAAAGKARVRVPVSGMELPEELSWCGYVSIEAEHYAYKTDTKAGEFRILPDYGRTLSAVKAFPQDAVFSAKQAPSVTYRFEVPAAGNYTVRLYTNPSNPAGRIPELFAGLAVNDERMRKINMVAGGFRVGDGSFVWARGVLDNNRCTETTFALNAGVNTLTVYALGPGLVLTKVVVYPEGQEPMKSYLGPTETPAVK